MSISMILPLGSELFTTVRLATGGLCSLAGLDLDSSEDCKVCVTESLLLVTHAGFSSARIDFDVDGGLKISVKGEGKRTAPCTIAEDEISAALLGALADDVVFSREDGIIAVQFGFAH